MDTEDENQRDQHIDASASETKTACETRNRDQEDEACRGQLHQCGEQSVVQVRENSIVLMKQHHQESWKLSTWSRDVGVVMEQEHLSHNGHGLHHLKSSLRVCMRKFR